MSAVKSHYDKLLAPVYSWTLGDFDGRVQKSEALFRSLRLDRFKGRALDLGCGTGVQTLALSRLGFDVTGVDFSSVILREYRARTAAVGAVAIEADISSFAIEPPFDVAVCLGDTVSHVESWDAVRAMFRAVHGVLRPGGAFVLASRDHSIVYEGDARFLVIRNDASQSLICFLEDTGEHVRVTDLLCRRDGTPLQVSSYLKLRVSPKSLAVELEAAGFPIDEHREEPAGIHVLSTTRGAVE
jgi:SAM-dependent methyltransferase